MTTVRVFKSGNGQAIRLPKEFRVECRELEIYRRGDEIVLSVPETRNLSRAFELLQSLPDDFLLVRRQEPPQTRDEQYTTVC